MSIDGIINLYTDEFGYVSDLDDLISFLKNDDEISLTDRNLILFKVLEHNIKQDEINKRKIQGKKKRIKEETKNELNDKVVEELDNFETSLIDVAPYITSLKKCDDDDFLTEILPSIYDNNYESIITSILLYLYQEIAVASKMLTDSTDNESIEYLTDLIKSNKKLIRVIKEYNANEETIEQPCEIEKNNTLIFLRRENNSLFINDDIDQIAIEDDVLPILNDIKTNRITREKRFHNHDELKGISAIRRRDSRIIFARLDNNVIVILGILVKRFQNPQVYTDMLEVRSKRFKSIRETLKEQIKDEDFINENNNILNDTIDLLNSRKKI